jgi:ornithine decarboxylase
MEKVYNDNRIMQAKNSLNLDITSLNVENINEEFDSDSDFFLDNSLIHSSSSEDLNDTSNNLTPSQSPQPIHNTNDSPYNIDLKLTNQVGKNVYDVEGLGSIESFCQSRIENGLETASFLVTNLATITEQYKQWLHELPMVEPFYAVKCNPDPAIVRLLASLGCNFDCATMGEIDLVCNHIGDKQSFNNHPGKSGNSIVYANPAKMEHMITFAIDNGVQMTVFDGEDELIKIAGLKGGNKMKLLLRLATDDKDSICQFSNKFGCPVDEAPALMDLAKSLGLNVSGVSFHVGSGCGDPEAYITALKHTRIVFDYALKIDMEALTIVDIGGGFPGDNSGCSSGGPGMPSFQDLSVAIRKGYIDFGKDLGRPLTDIRFIAEPGRYFVSACTAISTKVYSRKGGNKTNIQALYVDDGVYGSFNNVVYDHATPIAKKMSIGKDTYNALHNNDCIPTSIFGPTCDGLDQMTSFENCNLQKCDNGDWIIWENMGAYTHTASFIFNGYTHIPTKSYCNIPF